MCVGQGLWALMMSLLTLGGGLRELLEPLICPASGSDLKGHTGVTLALHRNQPESLGHHLGPPICPPNPTWEAPLF